MRSPKVTLVAALAALSTPLAAHATTVQYTTPCTATAFVVPTGVASITVEAFGAQGGNGAGNGGLGNFGGYAAATLTVIPGQSLTVIVGGQGGTSIGGAGTAGCNGGGAGGILGGGGGGGASDVRQGVTLADRVVVAGGGGGGGGGASSFVNNAEVPCPGGAGGAGGGLVGGDGAGSDSTNCAGGGGGGGGTQAAGGAAGGGAFNQTAGTLGQGGTGGNPPGPSSNVGGGGGGGGLYGGGGGGASSASAGGGGGGSGFVPTGGTLTSGLRAGDGLVRITYAVTTLASFRSLTAGRAPGGVLVRWRTAAQVGTIGFNVYRSAHGRRVRVNPRLIAATARRSYSYVDREATRAPARYWVQAVDADGSRQWYGPARVTARA